MNPQVLLKDRFQYFLEQTSTYCSWMCYNMLSLKWAKFCHYILYGITFISLLFSCYFLYINEAIEKSKIGAMTVTKRSENLPYESPTIIGAKYLVSVSSHSLKMRELSFATFCIFLREVCLFFNFWMIKCTIMFFWHNCVFYHSKIEK